MSLKRREHDSFLLYHAVKNMKQDTRPSRNYAFDGLKVLFILLVVVHHTNLLADFLYHGYICVEFFFMTSGYMLMRTLTHKPKLSVKQYSLSRLKKIYPHYVFSFFVFFILTLLSNLQELNPTFFYKGFTELLMVQNTGFFKGGFNYPCWYISVLFYSSIILFLACKYIKPIIFNILGAICVICTYGYILITNNNCLETWDTVLIFHLPLWRGIAGIILGMLIFQLHNKINFDKYKTLFMITELLSFAMILVLMCISKNNDLLILAGITLLMISIGNSNSLISRLSDNIVISKGIKFEYAIFLNHALIIIIAKKIVPGIINIPVALELIIIVAAVIIYSVLTTKLIDKITSFWFSKSKSQ